MAKKRLTYLNQLKNALKEEALSGKELIIRANKLLPENKRLESQKSHLLKLYFFS